MKKERITVIYHRTDYDGLFSALVINKYASDFNTMVITNLGYNYGDELPIIENLRKNSDRLILVDISFPPEYFINLWQVFGDDLIWIDHHRTAIQDSIDFGYHEIKGVRESGEKGACELTWEYMYSTPTPQIIKYISAHDTWDKNRFDWDKDVLPLQFGLRALYGMSLDKLRNNMKTVFSDLSLCSVISGGRQIKKYASMKWRAQVQNAGFEITVAGKLKGIAVLTPDFTSAMFESVLDKYQVFCICNIKKDSDCFSVSLYSETDGRLGDFDLGQYMKDNYCGGGHKTSAGGKLSKEQFMNLVFNKFI